MAKEARIRDALIGRVVNGCSCYLSVRTMQNAKAGLKIECSVPSSTFQLYLRDVVLEVPGSANSGSQIIGRPRGHVSRK